MHAPNAELRILIATFGRRRTQKNANMKRFSPKCEYDTMCRSDAATKSASMGAPSPTKFVNSREGRTIFIKASAPSWRRENGRLSA